VLPAAVITVVFAATLVSMRALSAEADENAVVVEITGHQWWWEIEYPELGISTANEFHIPIGRDVELRLRTDDVVHSLWLPELAGKLDLLPERVNVLVLRADPRPRRDSRHGSTDKDLSQIRHLLRRPKRVRGSSPSPGAPSVTPCAAPMP
jgi:hypothetical protein